MKAVDYLHLQMELEGIQNCGGNLITRMFPEVEDFPLILLAQTKDHQKILYFDEQISPIALKNKLTKVDLQSFEVGYAVNAFHSYGIRTQVGRYKTYIFPEMFRDAEAKRVKCLRQDDPKVIAFGFDGLAEQVYAIEESGKIISACVSSRENKKSAESWVFTDPEHRGKGLAAQVVKAWARSVLREGKVPFYSHAFENIGSAKLAKKLLLVHMYEETVIEYVIIP
jgi:RimJ/RimL family protein N-acetyltransferase